MCAATVVKGQKQRVMHSPSALAVTEKSLRLKADCL